MPRPGELTIESLERADRVILKLGGDLDLHNAPLLESAIAEVDLTSGGALVIDLDNLEFLDSSGLRALMAAAEDAQAHGRRIAVTKGSEQVRRLLDITGATARLPSLASAEELPV